MSKSIKDSIIHRFVQPFYYRQPLQVKNQKVYKLWKPKKHKLSNRIVYDNTAFTAKGIVQCNYGKGAQVSAR